MDIFKIAQKIVSADSESWKQFEQLIKAAEAAGYKFIRGLFEDNSSNVYWITALSKNPDSWEPYRAPRFMDKSDSYALWWSFDEELTSINMEGELIYEEADPDFLEEGEEAPEVNTDPVEPGDTDAFMDLSPKDQTQILVLIQSLLKGDAVPHWDDPPRAD